MKSESTQMGNKKHVTIKIWKDTHRLAKVLAASLGESMLSMLHRLVLEESKRRRNLPENNKSS